MKYIFICFAIALSSSSMSQTIIHRDKEIDQMIKEVNKDTLTKYINQLVSFGTRNTLSTQSNNTRGIGAARNWVLQKFNEYSKQSNNRLSAFIDTVTYPADGKRVDRKILLGNIVATLKGTDTSDKRKFIVSAHLDGMRTNVCSWRKR
jgi:hypothetical protein